MNVLDVIKDCIANPCFVKDYDLEECTVDLYSKNDTRSITHESSFSGYSTFKRNNASNLPSIDHNLLRMYMRVWAGVGKILAKTVTEGNCLVSLDIGYFFPLSNYSNKYAYSPTLELIERYGYTLLEDSCNISPGDRDVTCLRQRLNR